MNATDQLRPFAAAQWVRALQLTYPCAGRDGSLGAMAPVSLERMCHCLEPLNALHALRVSGGLQLCCGREP